MQKKLNKFSGQFSKVMKGITLLQCLQKKILISVANDYKVFLVSWSPVKYRLWAALFCRFANVKYGNSFTELDTTLLCSVVADLFIPCLL